MSTGDYLRYQRALKGGPSPSQIEEASGVASGLYRQIEQRYRAVGSDEDYARLAEYFEVPVDDLVGRREWTRKALSAALYDAKHEEQPITLELRGGQTLAGRVIWSDLGAVLLRLDEGRELVIQRHMIERWELTPA